jgi:septal ring factor EnvC (AmiA/AmiB activator)
MRSNRLINQNWQVVDVQEEIDRRKDVSPSDYENFFILAILYSHPRNRRPDYQAANRYLNEYLINLPTGQDDRQAQYICHLLEKINAADDEIDWARKQLEMKSAEQLTGQTQLEACRTDLKTVQEELQRSKKKSKKALSNLEKTQNTTAKTQNEVKRLVIENQRLKKQLEDLAELYINLERKRQTMQ